MVEQPKYCIFLPYKFNATYKNIIHLLFRIGEELGFPLREGRRQRVEIVFDVY